jgi:hypothetical protein
VVSERGGRDRVFGVTTIDRPTGELRSLAEILSLGQAKLAHATSAIEPGHTYSISDGEIFGTRSDCCNATDYLMTGYQRRAMDRQLTFDHVQVRATDPAGVYAH